MGILVEQLQRLEAYLVDHGLKMTEQRKVILEALVGLNRHVSLDELHTVVQQVKSGVGVATIYRTMRLFVEAEIVTEHRFDDGKSRYELAHEGDHHDHLICTKCGLIIEFEDEIIEEQQRLIAAQYGIHIETHKMELYGRCVDFDACQHRQSVRS